MANKSGASPQAVSLPVGGGDISGLGETFQPDLNSGTGNYSVPLEVLPGVRDIQPTLVLTYSTGAGNSAWGLGWALPIPTLARRTFRGTPRYDDAQDTFIYNGATELVEVAPNVYRAAVENSFERFLRTESGWEVVEKSGLRHVFGASAESRIAFEDAGQAREYAWLLERSEDTAGNAVTYHYRTEGSQRYLEEIRYAIYTIRFAYESRPDPFSEFRSGYELRTTLRCSLVALHVQPVGPEAVRTWHLEYDEDALSRLSLLTRVTQSGHDPETGASDQMAPLEFSYSGFDPNRRRYQKFTANLAAQPPGLDQANVELIDLDGQGLPGILAVQHGSPRYWPNRGNLRWGPPRALQRFPAIFSLGDDRVQLADMDGDGAVDVLVGGGPLSGYYKNNGRGGWSDFVHYARSPGLAFETSDLHLVDVNGDGLVDVVHAGRTGWHVYENQGAAGWNSPRLVPKADSGEVPPDLSADNPRVRLADMNGDGLLDIVLIVSGRIEYWPSQGNGRYGTSQVMADSPHLPYSFDPNRVLLLDINGNGLTDVVYVGYDEVTYWINQSGNGFSAPQTVRHTPPTSRPDTLRVADMNGTGTAGLLWTSPYADYRYLDFTGGVKPGLLERIDNHLGRVVTIAYGSSTEQALADRAEDQPWESFLPFHTQVVTSVIVDDQVSALHSVTQYRYHEGHYDGHRREFDGFARTEQIDLGDDSMPTSVTIFHFHTEASARAFITDPTLRRTLKRKLYQVEVYGRDGSLVEERPYHIEASQWHVRVEHTSSDGRQVLFPHITETSVSTFERELNARIDRRTFTYDQHGNVLTEERRGEGDAANPLFLRTEVEYAHHLENRILDRPARVVQRDSAGHLLGETRFYYDGPAFQGLPFREVTRGLLTRSEYVVFRQSEATALYGDHTPDFAEMGYQTGDDVDGQLVWLLNRDRRQFDALGNMIAIQDGLGHITSYDFDDFGLFAIRVTDAKNFAGTLDHDYRVGKPHRMVDPNGGIVEVRYDALGRIVQAVLPGDTPDFPTVSYSYDTTQIPVVRTTEHRVLAGQEQAMHTYEYLDGSGAIFQKRTEHDGSTFIVSGYPITNARGKMREKREPFFAEGGHFQPYEEAPEGPRRRFVYDALGRPIATINPDGGQSRAVYEVWQARFYNARGTAPANELSVDTPRVELYDAWKNLVAVREGSLEEGTQTTRYRLDALGQLNQITDAREAVLSELTYDMLGRRLAIQHADAGQRRIVYDAADNIIIAVDAEGQTVQQTYDDLNRILTTTYAGAVQEQYEYDEGPGTHLANQLARVIAPSGEMTFSYDLQGNVVERRETVPGQPNPFTFRLAYDRLGRVTALTYPDDGTVNFEYHSGLTLRRIPGYVDDIAYTAAGVRTAVHYTNGVRTEYRYHAATTQLAEIETWRPSDGEVFFHTQYAIDRARNIEEIADLRTGGSSFSRGQTLAYDPFDRLTYAAGVDHAGPYQHDYAYDAVGNFLHNPRISPHLLVYAQEGTSNRLVGFNNGTNTVHLFDYDANGNLTSMPGRTLLFDPKQQLAQVELADGTDVRFVYDHRGVLARRELSREDASSTTLYFGNLYEVRDGLPVRWVLAGELPVACDCDGNRVFLHNDHLGSTVVYTDVTGNLLAETSYYPFGAVAFSTTDGVSTIPLFTTKQFDVDIGLYYFNARWYAPDLGRFVSPDPLYVFEPEEGIQEPRRFNPYAYAGNNPLKFVDPSGLIFAAVAYLAKIVVVAVIAAVSAAVGAAVGGIVHRSREGAARGALIGMTAGLNTLLSGNPMLGIINFLAIFPSISQTEGYQGVLGWSSYLMPLSWPGHAMGLILFAVNALGVVFTLNQVRALEIKDFAIDWSTGNIFTVGGWVGNSTPAAFNLGGFSFVNARASVWLVHDSRRYESRLWVYGRGVNDVVADHESGHMLNNAAFGIFHTIPSIVTVANATAASYWERVAQSNVSEEINNDPARPRIPQWG